MLTLALPYIISFSRPRPGLLSDDGMTCRSNPRAFGSLASGSMPSSSKMLPIRSCGIDGAFRDLLAFGIRGADDVAALKSAAGNQHGEASP